MIRSGELDLGRKQYAIPLGLACLEAILCDYPLITVVEFGVAAGNGLLDLCKAAKYFRDDLEIDIRIIGLDNAIGLPPPSDYRDHPEFWAHGQYKMGDQNALRSRLPDFAELIIGDIAETARTLEAKFRQAPLGFAAVDVDYYSSSKPTLTTFTWDPICYMPAVPIYFDDLLLATLTTNDWAGEMLAIREFNNEHKLRKLQEKIDWFRVHNLFALQVLDHPIRTGVEKLRWGFNFINLGPI
jgi:hypothetical protein